MLRAEDLGNYFRITMDERDLNYEKYFEKGTKKLEEATEYTSDNTSRLDVDGMIDLLVKMGEIEG
jgi:UDP-glucose 4-epimerase